MIDAQEAMTVDTVVHTMRDRVTEHYSKRESNADGMVFAAMAINATFGRWRHSGMFEKLLYKLNALPPGEARTAEIERTFVQLVRSVRAVRLREVGTGFFPRPDKVVVVRQHAKVKRLELSDDLFADMDASGRDLRTSRFLDEGDLAWIHETVNRA